MMFLEYNWTFGCFQPRFGGCFTAVNGWRSFATLDDAKFELGIVGLRLGRKTGTRTWEIVSR
jgi:hypothetical protein